MKKYVLTIQRDYCSDWTVPDALRELLQNSLDSSSPFVYDIGDDYVEFTNKGVSLAANTLLLGLTSKRNDSSSVGGKGEGYKIALLILTREGIDVEILNGNRKWVPSIEWDHNYEAEMLHITETDLAGNNDLTFRVNGLSSQDIETTVENCLYLQDGNLLGNYATASCGSRVFFERSGKLYVGGLFVCNTNLKYVYDMHPSKLPLNRDRKQVTDWDLQGSTSEVLQEVVDSVKIVELAKEDVPDIQHLQYGWVNVSNEVSELAYEEFKAEYGEDCVVVSDYDEMMDMKSQGYENVVPVMKDVYRRMITNSDSYQSFLSSIVVEDKQDDRTPIEILEDWYHDKTTCREFEKILKEFKSRGVCFEN